MKKKLSTLVALMLLAAFSGQSQTSGSAQNNPAASSPPPLPPLPGQNQSQIQQGQGAGGQFSSDANHSSGSHAAQGNPSPTSSPGATNRIYGTNQSGTNTSLQTQDHAVTPTDHALLVRIRPIVSPQNHAGSTPSPVHITINQGVVTLVGSVATILEKDRILAQVQAVPGVARVVDQLGVGAGSSAAAGGTGAAIGAAGGSVTTDSSTGISSPAEPQPNTNAVTTGFTTQTPVFTAHPVVIPPSAPPPAPAQPGVAVPPGAAAAPAGVAPGQPGATNINAAPSTPGLQPLPPRPGTNP